MDVADPLLPFGRLSPGAPTWAELAHTGLLAGESWILHQRQKPALQALRTSWAYLVPYCVHPTKRKHRYCIVHRGYHALGCLTWTDYEAAEQWQVGAFERKRWLDAGVINRDGYLFDDFTAPWLRRAEFEDYLSKLRTMLQPWLEHEPPGTA